MGGHVSLDMVLNSISIQERVQDLNKVFWLLEVVLDSNEVVDSGSGVLEDAVEMSQTVPYQLIITLDIVDHIEETANCRLGLFLILSKKVCKLNKDLRLVHQTNVSGHHRSP